MQPDDETPPDATADEPVDEHVQERLPLDEPVPYRLTALGRRAVAPGAGPRLRVVQGGVEHVDLDALDGTARARARALRRTGMHTLDIAAELDVEPLHVEAWVGDLPVPPAPGAARHRHRLRAVTDPTDATDPTGVGAAHEVRQRWTSAADAGREEAEARLAAVPELRVGLGILSGVLEPDPHALVLAGEHAALVAAAWEWVVAVLEVPRADARVLVHVDPAAPGDRAARDAAATLGVDVQVVTTTRDAQRQGRGPLLRLRVSGTEPAGRALGWQRALLADVGRGAG